MRAADLSLPPRGAYTALDELIALRFSARQLNITRRSRALSALAGPNKSNFRGRGIDFEEVRFYQPGDDIRTIDWRVTARTGEAHTKLFREERERPVIIVADQRSRMFFGSSHCFKSVIAAHISALLAWSGLENGERVGGLVFIDAQHRELRPKRSRRTVLALLSEIDRYNHQLPPEAGKDSQSFADMLSKLRRIARPGSSLFIVSDFSGADTEPAREHLYQLAQHTEITAVKCSDPLEQQLPRSGRYAVTDGVTRSELNTADKGLQRKFSEEKATQAKQLASDLSRLGIPLIRASTGVSALSALQPVYGDKRR